MYGRPPFYHLGLMQKLHCLTNPAFEIKYPSHPLLCPQLKDVLKRCLQRNPRARPTVSELLQHPYLNPSSSIAHATSASNAANATSAVGVQIEQKQMASLLHQLAAVKPSALGSSALIEVRVWLVSLLICFMFVFCVCVCVCVCVCINTHTNT